MVRSILTCLNPILTTKDNIYVHKKHWPPFPEPNPAFFRGHIINITKKKIQCVQDKLLNPVIISLIDNQCSKNF